MTWWECGFWFAVFAALLAINIAVWWVVVDVVRRVL